MYRMEKLSDIELGLAYLNNADLVNDLTLQIQNIKKDLSIAYLTPSKFRANKSRSRTILIASKLQQSAQFPFLLAEKLEDIKFEEKNVDISHLQIYECGCDETSIMLEDEITNMLICPTCSRMIDMKLDSSIPKVRASSSSANRVKSLEVVYESLCMIQGLAPPSSTDGGNANPLPGTDDYKLIMEQLGREFSNTKRIVLDDVRRVIKHMQKRRHLKWAFYLYCSYTRTPPILMTNDEIAFITQMYHHVLNLTATAKLDSLQHVPHCLMIIYRLIDLCPMDLPRKHKYLNICHHPKLDTIRRFEQRFWSPICDASKKNGPELEFFYY
jgi:hypothetical protein